jgi:hypothetical protein
MKVNPIWIGIAAFSILFVVIAVQKLMPLQPWPHLVAGWSEQLMWYPEWTRRHNGMVRSTDHHVMSHEESKMKTLTMTIAALVLSPVAAFAWPIMPFEYYAPGRTLGEQPRAFWDYAQVQQSYDDEACFATEAKRFAAEVKRKREQWRKWSRT